MQGRFKPHLAILHSLMEWAIPLQKLEVGKINIGHMINGPKPLVPLSYIDGQIQFPTLTLILPPLLIKSYDGKTGRLEISLRENTQVNNKLLALQNTLFTLVCAQQRLWFANQQKDIVELQRLFQPLIDSDTLHLYCPILEEKKNINEKIHIFRTTTNGIKEYEGVKENLLGPGDTVRVALRIQGLSFHNNPVTNQWSGKFRLQHRILSLYVKPSLISEV